MRSVRVAALAAIIWAGAPALAQHLDPAPYTPPVLKGMDRLRAIFDAGNPKPKGPTVVSIAFDPPAPTVRATAPIATVLARVIVTMSDGKPATVGQVRLRFVQPFRNAEG